MLLRETDKSDLEIPAFSVTVSQVSSFPILWYFAHFVFVPETIGDGTGLYDLLSISTIHKLTTFWGLRRNIRCGGDNTLRTSCTARD